MTPRSRVAVVLAVLAGVLVLVRVVSSTMRSLVSASTSGLLLVVTLLLLLAALAFLAAMTWFVAGEGAEPRRWFTRALVAFLVVMAGYLALGLALAVSVPATAYAVLVGVAVLGSAAVVVDRRAAG